MAHKIRVRIYYEDTDCGGVVYYANYLRYLERARTEFFEVNGIGLRELMQRGIYFAVAEANVRYRSPGRYGDTLIVETNLDKAGPASIYFGHKVLREDTGMTIAEANVKLCCVNSEMRPLKLPSELAAAVVRMASGEGAVSNSGMHMHDRCVHD